MTRTRLRWWTLVATVLGGGTLLQVGAGIGAGAGTGAGGGAGFTSATGIDFGCNRFTSNGVLGATNFCFLLDCNNGFLGGLIDPCGDPTQGLALLDCPGAGGGAGAAGGQQGQGNQGNQGNLNQGAFGNVGNVGNQNQGGVGGGGGFGGS